MTFEAILDQAMAMLERRGRLSYRALKRQFNLDDDYLADLKAELIEAQRVAIDEGGPSWSGLVVLQQWRCHRGARRVPPSPTPRHISPRKS